MHSARDCSQPISAQNHQPDPLVSLAQYVLSSSVEEEIACDHSTFGALYPSVIPLVDSGLARDKALHF